MKLTLLAVLGLSLSASCQAPPNYGGDISLAIATIPTPPNVGQITGFGTVFHDPVYHSRGVRLTDACFDPSMVKTSVACPNGTAVADNANNSYSSSQSGSADDLEFNTGDFLTMVANQGGRHYLIGFDKNTLAISRPYASFTSGCPHDFPNCSNTGGWATADGMDFSLGDPCKIYTTSGTSLSSYTFGFDVVPFTNPCSNSISGPPAPVSLVNLVNNAPLGCVGTACNCLPSDFGTPAWVATGGENVGDTILVRAFSSANYHVGATTGQGTGFYVVAWSPTKGCISYNTSTGSIHGDPGWAGGAGLTCTASQCTGTSPATETFTLHNIKTNKSGNAVVLVPTTNINGGFACGGTFWIWVPGTATVFCGESTHASGHWVLGQQGLINDPGAPLYQFWYRTELGTEGTPTSVNNVPSPTCSVSHDEHVSWQSADASDTWPFLGVFSNANIGNSGLPPFDPPDCAWINELVMFDMNGDRQAHRMAFTFETGFSIFFNSQWGIAEMSPSGRFASVGSEWLNTLRNAGGTAACNGMTNPTSTCIPNGPSWKTGKMYAQNYIINPTTANGGNFSYRATVAGTSGASQPLWSTNCLAVGSTCSDNGITWTNVGAPVGVNAPGTDAFLWDLQLQITAPSKLVRVVQ